MADKVRVTLAEAREAARTALGMSVFLVRATTAIAKSDVGKTNLQLDDLEALGLVRTLEEIGVQSGVAFTYLVVAGRTEAKLPD